MSAPDGRRDVEIIKHDISKQGDLSVLVCRVSCTSEMEFKHEQPCRPGFNIYRYEDNALVSRNADGQSQLFVVKFSMNLSRDWRYVVSNILRAITGS